MKDRTSPKALEGGEIFPLPNARRLHPRAGIHLLATASTHVSLALTEIRAIVNHHGGTSRSTAEGRNLGSSDASQT